MMILLCGGTGMLGSEVAERLAARRLPFRALVRPATDAARLERLGAEVVRGDLREPASLARAMDGVDTVITTANAISRVLAGKTELTLADVDDRGNANLVRAAEAAKVDRFVFLSFPASILASHTPFANAKLATEERLRRSSVREVLVRPDAYQEVWLGPLVQFDWRNRSVTIFGKGDRRTAYVAIPDVAEAVVLFALADDPPRVIEFGGPETMTRNEVADAFEHALGMPMKRRHVPRVALRIGSIVLRPFRPALASVMGQALQADSADTTVTSEPLERLGISPRPVSAYIAEVTRAERGEGP